MQDYTGLYRTIQEYIVFQRLHIKTGDRHTHTQTHTQNLWNLEVLTHLKIHFLD